MSTVAIVTEIAACAELRRRGGGIAAAAGPPGLASSTQ
jgi:hypothetical protein